MMRYLILCCLCVFSVAYKSLVIKPGGLRGFYMIGICTYIQKNYDIEDWHIYGSSAGAWNALYLSCKKKDLFIKEAQYLDQYSYASLNDLERTMKDKLLNRFTLEDFDVHRLHLCVSSKRRFFPWFRKNIINDFIDLDDLIECCIASSHLPYVSNGKFYYRYRNKKCLDGGVFRNPHQNYMKPDFIIEPSMWKKDKIKMKKKNMTSIDIREMLYEGYKDAYRNQDELSSIFDIKNMNIREMLHEGYKDAYEHQTELSAMFDINKV
jgi:predicted patatin/cPLA2 family phospholipase